jgi:hypothetical protein
VKKGLSKKEMRILERVFTQLIVQPIDLPKAVGVKVAVKVTRRTA